MCLEYPNYRFVTHPAKVQGMESTWLGPRLDGALPLTNLGMQLSGFLFCFLIWQVGLEVPTLLCLWRLRGTEADESVGVWQACLSTPRQAVST